MEGKKEAKVEIVALTKDEIGDMMREAALVGAKAATDTLQKAHSKEEKAKRDRRLHNTGLLLRNYRTLKESCSNSVYEKTVERRESAKDVIDEIMTMHDDKVIVDSIRRSAYRTSIMVEHIEKMLDVYRIYCSKYSEREKRQYKVIKMMYISKQKSTVLEISKKFNVSKVTIYDDLKIAEERLSSLFFGIDGLNLY